MAISALAGGSSSYPVAVTVSVSVNNSYSSTQAQVTVTCTGEFTKNTWVQSSGVMFASSCDGQSQGNTSILGNSSGGTKYSYPNAYSASHTYVVGKSTARNASWSVTVYNSNDMANLGTAGTESGTVAVAALPSYTLDVGTYIDGVPDDTGGQGTFDIYINGSLDSGDVEDWCRSVPYGTTYTIQDIKPYEAYTYNGVQSGSLSGTVTDGVGVYLSFSTKTYTVSYNANGGEGAPESQTKTHGVDLALSAAVPEREGYVFCGWAVSADSMDTVYYPGGTYTGNAAVTLYAVWVVDSVTISFDANGGENAPSAIVKDPAAAAAVPDTVPVRAGYRFCGWAASQSAVCAEYRPGDLYSGSGTATLYAVWGGQVLFYPDGRVYARGFVETAARVWMEGYGEGVMVGPSTVLSGSADIDYIQGGPETEVPLDGVRYFSLKVEDQGGLCDVYAYFWVSCDGNSYELANKEIIQVSSGVYEYRFTDEDGELDGTGWSSYVFVSASGEGCESVKAGEVCAVLKNASGVPQVQFDEYGRVHADGFRKEGGLYYDNITAEATVYPDDGIAGIVLTCGSDCSVCFKDLSTVSFVCSTGGMDLVLDSMWSASSYLVSGSCTVSEAGLGGGLFKYTAQFSGTEDLYENETISSIAFYDWNYTGGDTAPEASGACINEGSRCTAAVLEADGTFAAALAAYGNDYFMVSFDADGGEPAPAPQLMLFSSVREGTALAAGTPEREGYVFNGWYSAEDGLFVSDGEAWTLPERDTVLTAQWMEADWFEAG